MQEKRQEKGSFGNLSALPPFCYIVLPSTFETVMVKRGESGFHSPPYDESPEVLNAEIGVTRQQEAAMERGVTRGWDSPFVDPDVYDDRGRLKQEIAQALLRKSGSNWTFTAVKPTEQEGGQRNEKINLHSKYRISGGVAIEAFPVRDLEMTIRPVPQSFSFSHVNFNGMCHDNYAQAEGVYEVINIRNEQGTYELRDFLDGRLIRGGFRNKHDAEMWLVLNHTGRDPSATAWSRGLLVQVEGATDHALAAKLEIPTYGDAMIFPSLGVNARAKIVAYQVLKCGALCPAYAYMPRTDHGRTAMWSCLPDSAWKEVQGILTGRTAR